MTLDSRLVARVDKAARREAITRSEVVRRLLEGGLQPTREDADADEEAVDRAIVALMEERAARAKPKDFAPWDEAKKALGP